MVLCTIPGAEDAMAKGACNCGTVQFEIDSELNDVYVCHCSICRRFTGSNGIAVVVVPNEKFRWLQGCDAVTRWNKPGADWEAWFCSVCGSAVPGANDPKTIFVPAGSITEGGEALKVAHHLFVGSKAGWDEIGDRGLQHVEGIRS
jgi:hypothetical protein